MNQMELKELKGQCIAEFLGTYLFLIFGMGCVAGLKLAGAAYGQWEISIIWGMAVALGVYLTAGVSGAHLNPAVTIPLWLFGCFDRRKVIPYIGAQLLGGFCAAATIYFMYYSLFIDIETTQNIVRGTPESVTIANTFSTYPNPNVTFFQAFAVETIITAILLCLILALTDDGNGIPRGPLAPLLIGILIAVIGGAFGPLTGFAMNPARDFTPKLFAYLAGWGDVALTGARDIPYFLVPLFAPILGGCLGAVIYRSLIGKNLPCQVCNIDDEKK